MAGGHAWQGVCVAGGGIHGRYYEIRSMSGRYASYWNAFLLINGFVIVLYGEKNLFGLKFSIQIWLIFFPIGIYFKTIYKSVRNV